MMAWALAVAVLLQGVGLVGLGRLAGGEAVQTVVVAAGVAVAVYFAWKVRLKLNHRIDMIIVMGAFGGLGMLAGWWIDLGFSPPPRDAGFHQAMGHGSDGNCCSAEASAGGPEEQTQISGAIESARTWLDRFGLGMAVSWMTALMLAGAVPPGVFVTRCADLARGSRRLWFSTHILGNVAMVVGMIYIGHGLGSSIGRLVGSNVVGAHLAMLGGMLVGMEAGMLIGETVLGLKPWREFRWAESREIS